MAGYFGKVGDRVEIEVTLINTYTYVTSYGWKYIDNNIFTFIDDKGLTYVWKTTSYLSSEEQDEYGYGRPVQKGDKIRIKATVKNHSTYKNMEQTELQRVKVLAVLVKAPTKEELEAQKLQAQLDTIKQGDIIKRMSYRQYKKHYSDCETLYGSYDEDMYNGRTIEVIIRAGRLKASGVRGKHYKYYKMKDETGRVLYYKAVSEENAVKRVNKEHKDNDWECIGVNCFDLKI